MGPGSCWGPVSYLVQTLNENVWKRDIDHVKIDSDDSAAEVAKKKEDCDLASLEIFPEETEQTSPPSVCFHLKYWSMQFIASHVTNCS